jgi:hypothetical protein
MTNTNPERSYENALHYNVINNQIKLAGKTNDK